MSHMDKFRGIVIPTEWDPKGGVTALAIATGEEEEFIIDDRGEMKKLNAFLREEVEVSGLFGTNGGSKRILKIITIEKVEKNEFY